MKIIIPRNKFLEQLLPDIEDYNKLTDADINYIKEAYTFGEEKPKVNITDNFVKVILDEKSLYREKQKLDQVNKFCKKQRYDKALKLVNQLLEEAPATSDYHRIKGQIFSDQNRPQEAIDELIEAVRLNPDNSSALIMLGNIYATEYSDVETALTFYERVLETNPDNHLALNNIGGNLAKLEKYDEAKRYFERALEINPDYPNTLYGLALLESKQNNSYQSFEYARQTFFKLNRRNNKSLHQQNLNLIKEESHKYLRGGGI